MSPGNQIVFLKQTDEGCKEVPAPEEGIHEAGNAYDIYCVLDEGDSSTASYKVVSVWPVDVCSFANESSL